MKNYGENGENLVKGYKNTEGVRFQLKTTQRHKTDWVWCTGEERDKYLRC